VIVNQPKDLPGSPEGFRISTEQIIFHKSINYKRLPIDFFGRIQNLAVIPKPPERTAAFGVPESPHERLVGIAGHLDTLIAAPGTGQCRKCPQQPGIQDQPLVALRIHLQRIGHPADKAPVLPVHCVGQPERNNIIMQLTSDTLPKQPHSLCIHV